MSKELKLKGAAVIVTGGSRGFGAGIAEVLMEAGANVWITGRDETRLKATAQRLGVSAVVADVTNPADWDRLFAEVLDGAEMLDILVNNAGAGGNIAPMAEQTDEDISKTISTNLMGPLFGCRRAAKIMTEQKSGIIINISSGCALHAWPCWGPYTAAKAGLNKFSHCLYTELREAGVHVTTITPYWGATGFVEAADIKDHPAGDPEVRKKIMQPREMGNLVLDICCTPKHLVIPDITVQPLIQQIEPM